MSKYLVEDSSLISVADAIRSKTGGTEQMTLEEMATAIAGIESGGSGDIDALIDGSITEITSNVDDIRSYSFYDCTKLSYMDLPAVEAIGAYALNGCSELSRLILRVNSACCVLGGHAIEHTPIASGTGYIYVPSALIEDYKVATNWTTYAGQFRALEDYTVDGTTTGELDETKI